MNTFCSFAAELNRVLSVIIQSDALHAKWINTLSYLENCGARKIAACEHPTQVKEEMLKHAAEEFRHAHHLKKQILKILPSSFKDYSLPYLLGGTHSLHYLQALDLQTSRYLSQTVKLSPQATKEAAYLLVTYAIELRAEELYPIYDAILRKTSSKVVVKSILLEEKEHLNEMRHHLASLPLGFLHAEKVCAFESTLCKNWLLSVEQSLLV